MFDLEYVIALHALQGIEPHLPARGCLMGFLELRQEPGLYS